MPTFRSQHKKQFSFESRKPKTKAFTMTGNLGLKCWKKLPLPLVQCWGKKFVSIDCVGISNIERDVGDVSKTMRPWLTRLLESEAEAEEPANRKAWSRTLSLAYSFASACDSDNAVFTKSFTFSRFSERES